MIKLLFQELIEDSNVYQVSKLIDVKSTQEVFDFIKTITDVDIECDDEHYDFQDFNRMISIAIFNSETNEILVDGFGLSFDELVEKILDINF